MMKRLSLLRRFRAGILLGTQWPMAFFLRGTIRRLAHRHPEGHALAPRQADSLLQTARNSAPARLLVAWRRGRFTLLALAQAGQADFLVSGDRRDLLELGQFGACKVVSTREMLAHLA